MEGVHVWILTHHDGKFVAVYSSLEKAKADSELWAKREDCTIQWLAFGGDKWIGYWRDSEGRLKKCLDNPRWKLWISEKVIR